MSGLDRRVPLARPPRGVGRPVGWLAPCKPATECCITFQTYRNPEPLVWTRPPSGGHTSVIHTCARLVAVRGARQRAACRGSSPIVGLPRLSAYIADRASDRRVIHAPSPFPIPQFRGKADSSCSSLFRKQRKPFFFFDSEFVESLNKGRDSALKFLTGRMSLLSTC